LDLKLENAATSLSRARVDVGEPLDIRALTRAMVKGDEMAYRIFYDAYYERLRRYLLVVTAGDELATRDALQSALVRVVRHIKEFASEAALWGWLTVVTRSAFIDQTRKRKRYWSFLERFKSDAQVHEARDDSLQAETNLPCLLDAGLATLPAEDRELLEAKYITGRSVRELAGDLQTSEKALESRLVRIRRRLKAALMEKLKDGRFS
jgi:RNA polymerase sigma-70 factor (ECF subfamily)